MKKRPSNCEVSTTVLTRASQSKFVTRETAAVALARAKYRANPLNPLWLISTVALHCYHWVPTDCIKHVLRVSPGVPEILVLILSALYLLKIQIRIFRNGKPTVVYKHSDSALLPLGTN